jgi:hypothetical protein
MQKLQGHPTKAIAFLLKSAAPVFGSPTASRFCSRDSKESMAQRGIMLPYETVGKWCLQFGQRYAKELHPSGMFVTIKGRLHSV